MYPYAPARDFDTGERRDVLPWRDTERIYVPDRLPRRRGAPVFGHLLPPRKFDRSAVKGRRQSRPCRQNTASAVRRKARLPFPAPLFCKIFFALISDLLVSRVCRVCFARQSASVMRFSRYSVFAARGAFFICGAFLRGSCLFLLRCLHLM